MIRRSIALSALETYLGILIQFVSSIVLARLLTPGQIGVFATAAVFGALASKVRDFGLTEYLIQLPSPTAEHVDSAFSTNVLVSWSVCGLMFAFSWPLAAGFDEPMIGEMIRLQTLSYLAIPFGAIHLAWHHRNLNFRPIVASGLASNLAGAVTSVGAASSGLGAMSLAWGALVASLVSVAAALACRSRDSRPRWRLRELAEVLKYGMRLSRIFLIGQAGRSAPDLVIAKAVDFAGVAHFSRATGLVELFNQSVMRVVSLVSLPALALADREGSGRLAAFERGLVFVTGIGWTFFVTLMLLAEPAVAVLYGDQWGQAVPLVRLLCAVAAVELTYALARDLLLSNGMAIQASRMESVIQFFRVGSLVLVFPFGLTGACIGLLAAAVSNAIYVFRMLENSVGVDIPRCIRALLPSAGVAALCSLPAAGWNVFVSRVDASGIALAVVVGFCTGLVWLAALRATRHPLFSELVGMLGGRLDRP